MVVFWFSYWRFCDWVVWLCESLLCRFGCALRLLLLQMYCLIVSLNCCCAFYWTDVFSCVCCLLRFFVVWWLVLDVGARQFCYVDFVGLRYSLWFLVFDCVGGFLLGFYGVLLNCLEFSYFFMDLILFAFAVIYYECVVVVVAWLFRFVILGLLLVFVVLLCWLDLRVVVCTCVLDLMFCYRRDWRAPV